MNDTVITVIVIFIAGCVIFIFPLMTTADRTDDIATQVVRTETTEFTDKIISTGRLTQDEYDAFIQAINSTGNVYIVEIEVQVLDDNPGKKVTEAESTKVGENYYYSIYTAQIMEDMQSDGISLFKEGDIISVSVVNTNRTIATILRDFVYSVTGNNSN